MLNSDFATDLLIRLFKKGMKSASLYKDTHSQKGALMSMINYRLEDAWLKFKSGLISKAEYQTIVERAGELMRSK